MTDTDPCVALVKTLNAIGMTALEVNEIVAIADMASVVDVEPDQRVLVYATLVAGYVLSKYDRNKKMRKAVNGVMSSLPRVGDTKQWKAN